MGYDGASIYCSSKFALEGWSESLYKELERFGIYAVLVEPGYFNTDFLDTSSVSYGDIKIEDYVPSSDEKKAVLDAHSHNQLGDPAKLGAALLKLAEMEKPPARYTAGSDALQELLTKAETLRSVAEEWRELTISTDGSKAA